MKKSKSLEKNLSLFVFTSLVSVGLFPVTTTASEGLQSNQEFSLNSSDQMVSPLNIETENEVVLPPRQVITIQTIESEEINNLPTASLATPENFEQTTFSQNQTFAFEPISLQEALQYQTEDTMAQVTSVTQLRDVSPTDWAYQALRNLVEKYDCIEGYPDRTFRGNRAMTRYEFAAGLNACLEKIQPAQGGVPEQELDILRRLVQQFQSELEALGTRVDNLEERVAILEDQQFSTTTKLFGQTIVGVQGRTDNRFTQFALFDDAETQINVITNTQLSLFTQFGPRSVLLTGLSAGSGATSTTGPALGDFVRLGYEADNGNDIALSDLTYRHLISDNLSVVVGTAGVTPVNVFRGPNRVESAGFGPLSRFAQRNPIISVGGGGTGAGFDWQLADRISFQGVYATNLANNSNFGGLFGGDNGSTTVGVQLIATPVDNLDVAFQYINAYTLFGQLGTGVGDSQVALIGAGRTPIQTDAFGGSIDWRIIPEVTFGSWVGYTTSALQVGGGDVDTFNWMTYLSFPDLFAEGNLGAIFVGQPPKITSSNLPVGSNIPDFFNNGNVFSNPGGQPASATHVEAFYRFKVNDNISITPGLIVVFNPGHNSANDTITIGAIRTTFTF